MRLPLVYNFRNLLVRKLSTALTFIVVGIVVFVLGFLLSFATGIQGSLVATGSPDNLIVLKPGASAESTSLLLPEESNRVSQVPGVQIGADGRPMISNELCVQTTIPRRGQPGKVANVAVRGVEEIAFDIHREVRLIEGRRFEAGQLECIVGKATTTRYESLRVGGQLVLGRDSNRIYTVVGVFDAGGGALESEVWAPRTVLSDSYSRPFVSSVVLRLTDSSPETIRRAVEYIRGPTVKLEAKSETAYYDELSSRTAEIVVLTLLLVGIMAVGAVFAVANTMYAAVDGRRREIAMLRTIGFARRSILISFVTEALIITTAACALGIAATLLLNGKRQDYLSDATWTVLAYELRVTPWVIAAALGLAWLVGVGGALAPALRASRVRVIEALRKA